MIQPAVNAATVQEPVTDLSSANIDSSSNFLRRLGQSVAPLVAAASLPLTAHGVLMPNGGNDFEYRGLGLSLIGDPLSMRITYEGPSGQTEMNTTATFINTSWAITAAMNLQGLMQYNPNIELANGNNFISDRGTVIGVDAVHLFPGAGIGNNPNLALLHFSTPYSSPIPDKVIGAAAPGDVVLAAGFGLKGTPGSGVSASQDGFSRGFTGTVGNGPTPTTQTIAFGYNTDGVFLNGKAMSLDAGGPVLSMFDGNLVGVITDNTGGSGPTGDTIFESLFNPTTGNWMQSVMAAPEPSTLSIVGLSGILLAASRRKS